MKPRNNSIHKIYPLEKKSLKHILNQITEFVFDYPGFMCLILFVEVAVVSVRRNGGSLLLVLNQRIFILASSFF